MEASLFFMEALLFWIFAVGALASGLVVALHPSPVTSALALAGVSLFLAGIFGLLGAIFLAIVQVLVYAGAVMVLFLFIIMLLDLKPAARRKGAPLGLALALAAGAWMLWLLTRALGRIPESGTLLGAAAPPMRGDAAQLGLALYTEHLPALLTVGLLLVVGMIGVLVLSQHAPTPEEKK